MSTGPIDAGARFTVVIVNYNGGAMLLDCVQSAVAEHVPASQIVVVDNGSTDHSIDSLAAAFPSINIILNSCNEGFARAVNRGLRIATGEFALLLNNDARLEPGALQAFADGFGRFPKLAIAGWQLRYPDGRLQSAFAPLPSLAEELLPRPILKLLWPRRFQRKALVESPRAVACVLGACLCVRTAILPRLGLLDEDYFFFFEEMEWCQRAGSMGAEVYYLPGARAVHGHGQTANRFRGHARVEYQRSKLTFFLKTRLPGEYRMVSAVLVIRTALNALLGSLASLATLFLSKPVRSRMATNWYLLFWHVWGRPASWGLPGKCPRQGKFQGES